MDLDNIKFENDEERRKYLSDLARLKKYQENAHNNPHDQPAFPARDYEQPAFSEEESYRQSSFSEEENYAYAQSKKREAYDQTVLEEKARRLSREVYDNNTDEVPVKKKKFPWALVIIIVLLTAAIGYFGYNFFFASTKNPGYYTVAVFGLDSRDGNMGKGALSDVNMIVQINKATGEIKLVSVYRDTYVQINEDNTYHKFNEAYFRGDVEKAVWAMETNFDIETDDYAVFNWSSIANAINILGGIDLEITDAEFKYINSFITETVESTGIYSTHLEHAGLNHLDGVQAVAYARLRLMDTDYQRTQRQRIVVELCLNKAKESDIKTLTLLAKSILPQIKTSADVGKLTPYLARYKQLHIGETSGFPYDKTSADIADRVDVVVPITMESNVIKLHEFLYPGVSYTPDGDVKRISSHIIEVSGLQ